MAKRVIIIGAGLAGMTVAKELLKGGLDVILLDSKARTGGKAGSDQSDQGTFEDHGYHVFPAWYENTRALLRELRADKDLIDFSQFHYLKREELERPLADRFQTVFDWSSVCNFWKNLRAGVIPWWGILQTAYFVFDLGCQRFSSRRYLDRISANGFLRASRFGDELTAEFLQYSVLQASSVPAYELSAMTMQKLTRAWAANPSPFLSILNGNLQTKFMEPLQRLVEKGGEECTAEFRMGSTVEKLEVTDNKISGLRARGLNDLQMNAGDIFVLATPFEVTQTFVDGEVLAAESGQRDAADVELFSVGAKSAYKEELEKKRVHAGLRREFERHGLSLEPDPVVSVDLVEFERRRWLVRNRQNRAAYFVQEQENSLSIYPHVERSLSETVHLEHAPMAAFNLHLKRRIEGIPREHVHLYGSRYLTSFVDVSQHWDELPKDKTVLNIIASDFAGLQYLNVADMVQHIVDELLEFLPEIACEDIERCYAHPNLDARLFLNTVASWKFRPGARTRISNLYVTGDYCRSEADLATMESTVTSALRTASAILADQECKYEVTSKPLKLFSKVLAFLARSAMGLGLLLLTVTFVLPVAKKRHKKKARLKLIADLEKRVQQPVPAADALPTCRVPVVEQP